MRDVNLIVIGDKACGTTRAYLAYLNAADIRPKEVWLIDFYPASESVKKYRKVPIIGSWLSNNRHRREEFPDYWPPEPFDELCDKLQKVTPLYVPVRDEFGFERYAGRVRHMVAEDYDDPYLLQMIKKHRAAAFLYTNGGRVPGELLSHPDIRIFHIHPGVVPYVRGSDCFLWSLLARGKPGASCFYMSAGIDEGDVLDQVEFDLPDVSFLESYLTSEHEDIVCRAIAKSFDPHMRAMLFSRVMRNANSMDLKNLKAVPQEAGVHHAYLWMHPKLRLEVLKRAVRMSRETGATQLRFSQT